MADAQLKLSRRALLGAPLLPLTLSGAARGAVSKDALSVRSEPGRGPPPSEAEALHPSWNRALSRLRRAEAAVLALEGGPDEDAFGRAHDR